MSDNDIHPADIPPVDIYGILNLRCFTEPVREKKGDEENKKNEPQDVRYVSPVEKQIKEIGHPHDGWVFVLDIETTTGISQRPKFGIYHLYGIPKSERVRLAIARKLTRKALDGYNAGHRGLSINHPDLPVPHEKGIFYNPDTLEPDEIETIKLFARAYGYFIHTIEEFVKGVFYRWVYYYRSLCAGHNLAFDLSRLATSWKPGSGQFRGGFSLKLCDCGHEQCYNHPAVRIKHIGRPKRLMDFQSVTIPGAKAHNYKGAFLDTATFGNAILGTGDTSLEGMGKRFNTRVRKTKSPGHGQKLTFEYLEYAVRDVEATYSLYQAQRDLYRRHGLSRDITKIYSEASLGKAYFEEFGVVPFMQKNPDFPREILGHGMAAYYGGRAEIGERLKPTEVIYTDFKSQYPTANALMRLQDLLLAERVEVRECTEEVREWLDTLMVDKLLDKEEWPYLRKLVKIKPSGDLLPVRTDYGTGKQTGLNHLTADETWYTLEDIAASKIPPGKTPEVLEAIEFIPVGRQKTNKIKLFGDERFLIDLDRDDLFTKVIDLRDEVKKQKELTEDEGERRYLKNLELALKLLANSTSYGVQLEIVAEERTENGKEVVAWCNDGHRKANPKILEKPGKYFAGPIGALIPAGGRLLLAMAEALAKRKGIGYAMCDTDSLAFARPEDMDRGTFRKKVEKITSLFDSLSPYEGNPPILEWEDINYDDADNLLPLYFIGISPKRYALYNRNDDGTFTIRKFSSHGLGVWRNPGIQDEEDEDDLSNIEIRGYVSPAWIPEPRKDLKEEAGYRRWIYDLWYQAIKAVEDGDTSPDISKFDFPDDVVATREVAFTSPHLMDIYPVPGGWPFGFFDIYPALSEEDILLRENSFGDDYLRSLKGVICYSARGDRENIYRKDTGGKVDIRYIKTLKEALRDFFTHRNSKSANPTGIGIQWRRHVMSVGTVSVGKVINRVTEHTDEVQDIGLTEGEQKYMQSFDLKEALKDFSIRKLAKVSGVPVSVIQRAKSGQTNSDEMTVKKILRGLEKIKKGIDYYPIKDTGLREALGKLAAAREEMTWKEISEVTELSVETLKNFQRAERIGKKSAQKINENLPVIGMGVNEFKPVREKLINSGLSPTVLSDLLGVKPRILREMLECQHSPRPLTANRIKENLPVIDAYLNDLEGVKDTLNKLLSKYSQRELSRITGIPQRTISDLLRGVMSRNKTLMSLKSRLQASEYV